MTVPSDLAEAAAPPASALGATLADVLASRARLQPDRLALRDLRNDLGERDSVTYAGLFRRALTIAARLAGALKPGDRALLITPYPIDYIAAMFGCFYAGVAAVSGVPAYAPSNRSLRHTARLRRLHAVIEDCGAAALIGPGELLERIDEGLDPGGRRPLRVAVDGVSDMAAPLPGWRPEPTDPRALAMLQYTSGSTSSPGGVILRHANLMANLDAQAARLEITGEDVGVSWLPLHHDLGLIGACQLSVFAGFPLVQLPPAGFLEQPRRWLDAISDSGATVSWAPNFAYKLCLKAVPPEARRSLDLSRWRIALNAAEPVQAATLRDFAAGFAAAGLRPRAAYPAYGLAEATLLVSAPRPGSAVRIARIDKAALARDEVALLSLGAPGDATELVGCGQPLPGVDVAIVDPKTGLRCEPGRVGEIWTTGPSRSEGYFRGAGGPRESPDGRLPDGDARTYLRTGDLGFMLDDDLFVTGRLKDVIILRGANVYPQDLEATASASHPALRDDYACAFPAVVDGDETLVIACEIDRRRTHEAAEAAAAMRRALFQDHGLETYAAVVIPFGAMPMTPSGKVQRKACMQEWRSGALPVLHQDRVATPPAAQPRGVAPAAVAEVLAALRAGPLGWVLRRLAQLAPDVQVDITSDLSTLGLTSLQITELAGDIEARFGVRIPAAELFDCRRVADIVARLDQTTLADPAGAEGATNAGSRKAGSG